MRAMILAAGRGERMGELTRNTPKPLLRVGEKYLIEYAIANLVRANIRDVVINISYHGEQIKAVLGDGKPYGINIVYSEEKERLETGGGILQALPLLGDQAFVVISSDVITDIPINKLPTVPSGLAHLLMVKNPSYHLQGDFGLRDGYLNLDKHVTLTFANVSVLRPELFANCTPAHFRLTKLLIPAILQHQVTGEQYQGIWYNVGTPTDLADLNLRAQENKNFLAGFFDSNK